MHVVSVISVTGVSWCNIYMYVRMWCILANIQKHYIHMGCIKTMHLVMVGWPWLALCYGLKLFLFGTNACYKWRMLPEARKKQIPISSLLWWNVGRNLENVQCIWCFHELYLRVITISFQEYWSFLISE